MAKRKQVPQCNNNVAQINALLPLAVRQAMANCMVATMVGGSNSAQAQQAHVAVQQACQQANINVAWAWQVYGGNISPVQPY